MRDTVRTWVDENLMPVIGEAYIEGKFPKQLIPGMAELGLFGANLPEEYGCAGLNNVAYGLIMQELERGDSGIRSFASVQGALVMYPIYAFGSDEQKKHWLPRLARGQEIGCFGLTEPDYGSNPGGMITTARETKDGWVLNGTKMWITNGSQATVADHLGQDRRRRTIRSRSAASSSRPTPRATPRKDQKGKLSLRASDTSEIHLAGRAPSQGRDSARSPAGSRARSCASPRRVTASPGARSARRWPATTRRSATPSNRVMFDKPIGADPDPAGAPGRHADRDHQGPVPDAAARPAQGRGHHDPGAGLARQAQQREHGLRIAREARRLLGANGILVEYHSMRHMANLESVYTYEGTHDMHSLILGQAITGLSAYT